MKVLVDYQIFLAQRYGGISNYHSKIHEMINGLESGDRSTIIALGSENKYIRNQLQLLRPLNVRGKRILTSINQYALEQSIPRYDVFHPTYYDNYFLKTEKIPPFVITIHDVIPEKFFTDERGLSLIRNKKNLIAKAARIIAISETTKRELLNYYDVDPSNIVVIPHGRPDEFKAAPEEPEKSWDREQPYLLYVGLRGGYKNFSFLLQSSAPFLLKYNMRLKVAGPPPAESEIKLVEELNLQDKVEFLAYPSLEELYTLYHEAFCFAFPSLEEGFGIPLLEAAAAGCPVICSDIGIFHEISGDSVLYFDPHSGDSVNLQLEKLVSDSSLRQELTRRSNANLAKYSWIEAAKRTLNVYQQAAASA
ncbi:MAG TPA: glycosyltransferase family 1 protein [Puia sp.]|nr:glycosyltransferase family 1 protein [Puia sp.]